LKSDELMKLEEEVRSCDDCGLCEGAKNPVVGEGNPDSEVVFVGEAPGKREDELGRPFVGTAGRLLDRLLGHAGLRRDEVYITNVVKCRPPGNRRPRADEIEACSKHLERLLAIMEPRVIAPMGNTALEYFFDRFGIGRESIGDAHGRAFEADAGWGRVLIVPLYHPAAAIYRRDLLPTLEGDMEMLRGLLG